MKAVVRDRYGSPDVLRLAEVGIPSPGSGEVRVKVCAASLNTADSDHLQGRPRIARIGFGLRRPSTGRVGLDVAGIVDEVGADVTGIEPGDEVWADLFGAGHGSLGEYVCAPARVFSPKPAGVTFEEAATVPHSGVLALQGLRAGGGVRPGDSVLIIGAGGCVGPFAVQIAKARGAEVTAVDHGSKIDLLRELGADHVIDYTRHDVTRGGRRYERILDIADARSVLRYRRCLLPGGSYVLVARTLSGFVTTVVLGGLITLASGKRMGVFGWRPNVRADLEELAGLLEQGLIRPVIDRTFALRDAADAFAHLQGGHARGKVVLVPGR